MAGSKLSKSFCKISIFKKIINYVYRISYHIICYDFREEDDVDAIEILRQTKDGLLRGLGDEDLQCRYYLQRVFLHVCIGLISHSYFRLFPSGNFSSRLNLCTKLKTDFCRYLKKCSLK